MKKRETVEPRRPIPPERIAEWMRMLAEEEARLIELEIPYRAAEAEMKMRQIRYDALKGYFESMGIDTASAPNAGASGEDGEDATEPAKPPSALA